MAFSSRALTLGSRSLAAWARQKFVRGATNHAATIGSTAGTKKVADKARDLWIDRQGA